MIRTSVVVAGLASLVAPAAAQFDALHNHLTCYRIKDAAVVKRVVLDDQFGRSLLVKLTPQLLCTPTEKTCCDPARPGCAPIPCGADPIAGQPLPHFKCYRAAAKRCTDASCAKVTSIKAGFATVDVTDQFGLETVRVGAPQLLCAPAEKTVPGGTTTTTSPPVACTTTTTIPCHGPDPVGQCGGQCPVGMTCAATSATACGCVPDFQLCGFQTSGACGGVCANTRATCFRLANSCGCGVLCGSSAPQCDGACLFGGTCQSGPGGCTCPNGG